jgi:hypothetical protein
MKKKNSTSIQVNDDFSYVSPIDGRVWRMTMKERRFCDAYLDFKADGVSAVYAAGYACKNANVAKGIAYNNLTKPNLIAYINSRLEETGFNDDLVMKQHLFLMQQHANLPAKAKAVEMYYKLKGLNAPDKSIVGVFTMADVIKNLNDNNGTDIKK